ncbi:putative E3 ubiquitin-protein ligase UBR7 [Mytilus galloprovincialis]|uniref:putative E3 ubiquitin-protein ligase UBR7 n=1 Tax=Mytilus galloprovincialis TaxID=29158 RepID=UPI003F7BB4B0
MATNESGQSSARKEETQDEDSAISMLEVLQEQEELEADANAVLGDSDAVNCTYVMGYVPRQALYACMTCNTSEPSGICLACSYECHDGHDLIELYTKRNFKCDCGNGKFKDQTCQLYERKSEYNVDNRYNHNFRGIYCVCDRPYPDPDDDVEDEMIQCIMCEDWYHGRHLGFDELPENNVRTEMVCRGCMSKHDFLWAYTIQSLETQKLTSGETSDSIDVASGGNDNAKASKATGGKHSPAKRKKVEQVDNASSPRKSCHLKELQKRKISHKDTAAFFADGWRSKLCTCTDCKNVYCDQGIEFLSDESDTVHAYEVRGKEKSTPTSQYDKGLQALSNMNRLQQVEVLHGYNDLKSELNDYLKKFAENKKVVREEDIREFFSTLEARKRQRKSSDEGMSYFCK